jgi:site-specific DNA-methyltransferase (adenine-specific)
MRPYYDCDGITIYHGEALEVLADLPEASVDALVTDPPYSSGGQYRGDRMVDTQSKYVQTGMAVDRADFAGDNRDQRSYHYWCALWLSRALDIAKPGSPACLFTDWRQLPITTDALQAGGWVWRGIVGWDKTEQVRPTMGRFASQMEFIVWGSAGAMPLERGVGCLPGVFRYNILQADKFHQTGKPTKLMQDLLRIVPPEGKVLDPFMGSGTTLVAARDLGLTAIGVERVEANCEITARRLDQAVLAL